MSDEMSMVVTGVLAVIAGAAAVWWSLRAYRGLHPGVRLLTLKMRAWAALGPVAAPCVIAAGVAFIALGIGGDDPGNPVGAVGMVALLTAGLFGFVTLLWSLAIVILRDRALPPPFREAPRPTRATSPSWPMAGDRRG